MSAIQDEVDAAGLAHKWIVQSTRLPGLLTTNIVMKCCDEQLGSVIYHALVKPTCSDGIYAVEADGAMSKLVSCYRCAVMAGVRELIKLAGLYEVLAERESY